MKTLLSKIFSFLKTKSDKAAVEEAGIAMVVILIIAIGISLWLFYPQIGRIGLTFWNAVIGFFDSIPNGLSDISYAITNGISSSITSFFNWLDANATGGVTSAFSWAWTQISNFFTWLGSKIGLSIVSQGAWAS